VVAATTASVGRLWLGAGGTLALGACSLAVISIPSGNLAEDAPPHGGGGGGTPLAENGGGSCPERIDAAACPSVPGLQGIGAWVGCSYTGCSASNACTTCHCLAVDGGASWDCDAGASE
jgi:hypothetical protein